MAKYYCNLSAGDTVNSILANGSAYDVSISQDIDARNGDFSGPITATTGTFSGAVSGTTGTFTGQITASTASAQVKAFNIPHPIKEGKRLWHGCLEGPEYAVYVRGRLTDDDSIILPDYWSGLVHEDTITVQLTAIGKPQELYVREIKNNRVRVAAKTRGTHLNYFYFIQAERKDVEKMVVEY